MKTLRITKDSVYKIAILGPDNVGKTTLIHRYCDGVFPERISPTLGVQFQILSVKTPEQVVRLQIWDIGGNAVFQNLWESYVYGVDGIIFAFDISKKSSLTELEQRFISTSYIQYTTAVKLLISTKNDCAIAYSLDMILSFQNKYQLQTYIPTSSLFGQNIEFIFRELAKQLLVADIAGNGGIEEGDTEIARKRYCMNRGIPN